MKKGQVQTQIFVYLLALVIVGLVLLYGYRAISGFRERQEEVSLIEFENQLENAVVRMASRYGSMEKITLTVPGNHKYVCFADNYEGDALNRPSLGQLRVCEPALDDEDDPKVQESDFYVDNAIEAGTANIFLVPNGESNYLLGNIDIDDQQTGVGILASDGCLCIQKTGSEVILNVEGLGDGVKISKW